MANKKLELSTDIISSTKDTNSNNVSPLPFPLFFFFFWVAEFCEGRKNWIQTEQNDSSVKPLLTSTKSIFPLSHNQLKKAHCLSHFFWPKGVVCK